MKTSPYTKLFRTALCVASAAALPALADVETGGSEEPETAGTESGIEAPSVEAGVFYRSMKIERGMVENKESVFGYEAEISWYGLFLGIEACHDMTDIEGRKGRYNEIECPVGYEHAFGDFKARAAYVCKICGGEEPDTQEVEIELEYETPWLTPFVECDLDVDRKAGALYSAFGVSRAWEFDEWAALVAKGGVGFGNAYRNAADFGSDKYAMRDIHLGLALELEVCPHVKIVPGVDLYDYFTAPARHTYRKGFAAVGGVCASVEF